MGVETAEALLLDVFDLGEHDQIVTLLTAERGKVRGVARGARRKYSRFAGQLRLLSRVRATWFEKPGRELVRISGIEVTRPAEFLLRDLEGILLAGYLAEHMLEFAQENEESRLSFRLLDSTLAALESGVDRDLAARYYEAWVLRLGGVFPPPAECPACGRDLRREGAVLPASGEGLLCRSCGAEPGGRAVEDGVLALLQRIGRESLPVVATDPPGRRVLEATRSLSARVRRGFLQHELKSYRVMEETLARSRQGGG